MEKPKIEVSIILISAAIVFFLTVSYVYAAGDIEPTYAESITTESSTRFPGQAEKSIEAEAGNVTELTIYSKRSTEAWQGYYGNITGTITLDDAQNNTMYDWQIADPEGEIYASNGSGVVWADVACVDFTAAAGMNETTLETFYGINETDLDGFSETFNETYSDALGFRVGGVTINDVDSCHMAYTFVDGSYQTTSFKEVLLTDSTSIIFTTLLESNVDGFKTGVDAHDFQMLVAEDGHPGQEDTTTTYWFYVELS
ncbi:MAG: hypothetical protein PHV16_03405 [Candidatus Nanoarchaeia archaeon]|nr:hypothetical protein [Candidatus Nanoarchaeia archaeon]